MQVEEIPIPALICPRSVGHPHPLVRCLRLCAKRDTQQRGALYDHDVHRRHSDVCRGAAADVDIDGRSMADDHHKSRARGLADYHARHHRNHLPARHPDHRTLAGFQPNEAVRAFAYVMPSDGQDPGSLPRASSSASIRSGYRYIELAALQSSSIVFVGQQGSFYISTRSTRKTAITPMTRASPIPA